MRLFTYVIVHDLGFAPNPFHGHCTLATCKPQIRYSAERDDWIIATGSANKRVRRGRRLVYAMQVERVLSFEDYWNAPEFECKRPIMNGSFIQRFGDNIYTRSGANGAWSQLDSRHSQRNGILNQRTLKNDTAISTNVLVGREFVYWGGDGPELPTTFDALIHKGIGHHIVDDHAKVSAFLAWLKARGETGVIGDPLHWGGITSIADV